MNRTGHYISRRKDNLSIYFTADFPVKGATAEIIKCLQEAGADLIEVGIPFSDPLADGPVIQRSSAQALKNGFTLDNLFSDLKKVQSDLTIPLVLMGYFNTLLAYGLEKFLSRCKELNIDTLILPDLPPDIYIHSYSKLFQDYGVSPVFLITPQTTDERIGFINGISEAFVYAVADNSVTGVKGEFSEKQLLYFKRIKDLNFQVPVLTGFGISNGKTYRQASEYVSGVIIGSAFIQSIEKPGNLKDNICNFINSVKEQVL